MEHKPYGPYETYFKRPLDILCALAALIVFGWLYILVAVLVRIMLGSPVIFKQPRPGKDEKIFDLYKFRSMTDERDENGELLPDEQRLTKFGKVLRATSLDELPEAFNILKGDMSVIGPRPLLVKYLPRYSERQHRRHIDRSVGRVGGGAGHTVGGDGHIQLFLRRVIEEHSLAQQRTIRRHRADGKEDGTIILLGKLRDLLARKDPFSRVQRRAVRVFIVL